MALHHQPDEALAFVGRLGEELLRRRENRFRIGLHFDLRYGFHRDRHALPGVEVLLRRDVERHQLERQPTGAFHHGENHGSAALHHARATETVYDDGLVRPRLAEQLGEHGHQEQNRQDHQAGDHKRCVFHKCELYLLLELQGQAKACPA